jgi:hypothetical protein
MSKPALASKTVRNSLYTTGMGIAMAVFSFAMAPENVDRFGNTAKIWGLERHFKVLMAGCSIATSIFGLNTLRARHRVEGPDKIYTPDYFPIGRNLSDIVQTVGIADVFTAVNEVKDITGAKDNSERLNEIGDLILKLNAKFDGIEQKMERPAPPMMDAPMTNKFTGELNFAKRIVEAQTIASQFNPEELI